jgi:hypothetical protein
MNLEGYNQKIHMGQQKRHPKCDLFKTRVLLQGCTNMGAKRPNMNMEHGLSHIKPCTNIPKT